MTALLDAREVSKSFSGIRALHEVSMHVDEGERVGLICSTRAGDQPSYGGRATNTSDVKRLPTHS